jgi:hypothetical protein
LEGRKSSYGKKAWGHVVKPCTDDTLKANVSVTCKCDVKGHEWRRREDVSKVCGKSPRESKLERGSGIGRG